MASLEALLKQKQDLAERIAKVEQSILVEEKSDEIRAEIAKALDTVDGAKELLGNNYILAWRENGDWQVQINAITKLRARNRGNGNGNGNGNFKGKPVDISEEIKAKYGLEATHYDSIRKLALALGVSKDDRHPDQTLRQTFEDVWQDIKGEGKTGEVKETQS